MAASRHDGWMDGWMEGRSGVADADGGSCHRQTERRTGGPIDRKGGRTDGRTRGRGRALYVRPRTHSLYLIALPLGRYLDQ